MHVEAWSERETERVAMATACSARGFVKAKPRSYTETVWLDLSLPEDDLLGSFHRSARRNIKIPQKKGMVVRPITEAAAIPRIREIFADAFRRTGGVPPSLDWNLLIATNGHPGCRHNVVGLFPSEGAEPVEVLSFAVAFLHGEVAEFAHAGSAREPGLRVPLSYAPAWELMVWARAKGARFWDFGGVTSGAVGTQGPLAGINAFKLYFSPKAITVGEEWVLEPRRMSASFLRTISYAQKVWIDKGLKR
jgi:lipid II:glycine glycyltransferase (peptidoglycan interpeptide bridge formation enzyme)